MVSRGATVCALLLLAGCDSQVGSLLITVTRSPDPAEEPLRGVASLVRIRIDGPDLQLGPLTVPLGDGEARLPALPVGEGRRATLEGLGPEGNLVSRGRSIPFQVTGGETELPIYVGLSGTQGQFSLGPDQLGRARAFHAAVELQDGSLLLSGGTGGTWRPEVGSTLAVVLRSSERVEASSLRLEPAASCLQAGPGCLKAERIGHSASLLPSGNVLIAGGSNGLAPVDLVELYEPPTRSFLPGPKLRRNRLWHQAAATDRGLALIGGVDAVGSPEASAEVYDQGVLSAFPALQTPRRGCSLTSLADGTLLVAGGIDGNGAFLRSTELLGPGSPRWVAGPELQVGRAYHSATLLTDGSLLMVGGLYREVMLGKDNFKEATGSMERLHPEQGAVLLDESLDPARWYHTATLLADGRVLLIGGFGANQAGAPVQSVAALSILGESQGHLRQIGTLRSARAGHSATRMGSDLVVVAGGHDGSVALDTVEVFVY